MSQRLSMRKIRDIIRLKWEMKRSYREIGQSINVSISTVGDCIRRAKKAGLSWPLPPDLSDTQLIARLYPNTSLKSAIQECVDWTVIHQSLKRKGVTLYLLWEEYKAQYPDGIGYSRFCAHYRNWRQKLNACMRFSHKAGEKLFVDYCGLTMPIIDPRSGEIESAQIFVATLGASNLIYAEATRTQTLPDWIGSHVRTFQFLGGLPEIVVPDNLKSGVSKPHRYDPDLNPTYQDMAEHYGIAVIPTRVAAPQDKAKVEQAVQMVERRILAKLRDRAFHSITDLNQAIKPLLEAVNKQSFQKLPGTRLSQFEALEKSVLKPLPQIPYQFAEWKKATPGVDYHIAFEGHYYSVPYTFIKKRLDVRFTQRTVEVFHQGQRIASHQRDHRKGRYTTVTAHMPEKHRAYAQWTPERLVRWAEKQGPYTAELSQKIIASRPHPQQGFRACMGLMRLGKSYGTDRLEAACQRALHIRSYRYKSVESILKNHMDKLPLDQEEAHQAVTQQTHEYIRGKTYFQTTTGD